MRKGEGGKYFATLFLVGTCGRTVSSFASTKWCKIFQHTCVLCKTLDHMFVMRNTSEITAYCAGQDTSVFCAAHDTSVYCAEHDTSVYCTAYDTIVYCTAHDTSVYCAEHDTSVYYAAHDTIV